MRLLVARCNLRRCSVRRYADLTALRHWKICESIRYLPHCVDLSDRVGRPTLSCAQLDMRYIYGPRIYTCILSYLPTGPVTSSHPSNFAVPTDYFHPIFIVVVAKNQKPGGGKGGKNVVMMDDGDP